MVDELFSCLNFRYFLCTKLDFLLIVSLQFSGREIRFFFNLTFLKSTECSRILEATKINSYLNCLLFVMTVFIT